MTTQVSRYQKGKTDLDFTEARDSEQQWHQLGRMQVCTSLQTDNHARTPPLSFFTGGMPFLTPNQQRQRVLKLPRNPPMASKYTGQFSTLIVGKLYAFSALTLLVGRQEEHPVCYN